MRVIALVGATASGKARLAFEAARRTGAELLSCDSMKVYRGLDIGTAKPTGAARTEVTWHGLDLVDPQERFDAAAWAKLATDTLEDARRRNVPVLVAGGTVLYLKALTEGLFDGVPRDAETRARIREEAEAVGSLVLHERLRGIDPAAAARIHPNDLRRIERALEVHALTGKPITELQGQFGKVREGVERVLFAVAHRREDLDRRINRRVDRMVAEGWLDEVRRLSKGPLSREAEQALGYRELLELVRGGEKGSLEEVVETIKTRTRRFARKQLNWLRHHMDDVRWLETHPGAEPVDLHLDELVRALQAR